MNTNLKQRKADVRYRVMSKRPRRDSAKYYMIGFCATIVAGSLEMQGTPSEMVIGAISLSIALWAGSIAYYEDWYEKETYKRNLQIELQD